MFSGERGGQTNLEVEGHSRALHIRLVAGRRRSCSDAVQIVLVDCESRSTRRYVSNRLCHLVNGLLGDIAEVLVPFSFFSGREDTL